jgi:hypothetical protein
MMIGLKLFQAFGTAAPSTYDLVAQEDLDWDIVSHAVDRMRESMAALDEVEP